MSAFHPVNQNSYSICLLERKWVVLWEFGHEREHRELGIAIHEHVLDELLGGKAVDRIIVTAGTLRKLARICSQIYRRSCAKRRLDRPYGSAHRR